MSKNIRNAVIKFLVWLVVFILLLNTSLELISGIGTIANIIGIALLSVIILISFETHCFITLKIQFRKQKKEKDEE